MAGIDDDVFLARAILALCEAIEEGGTNAEKREAAVELAKKSANAVLNRNQRKDADA